MLFSFDIFDTLITRRVANPTGIFAVMQHKLNAEERFDDIPDQVKKTLYYARIAAEKFARRACQEEEIEEVSIENIYDALRKILNMTQKVSDRIQSLEFEVEYDNIRGIDKNFMQMKEHINRGEKVILISDMYWHERELHRLLKKIDAVFDGIQIYSSCDYKVTKQTGKFYKIIRKIEGIDYKDWVHFGDNVSSDYKIPMELGISASLFKWQKPTGFEEELSGHYGQDKDIQYYLGCSRNARLDTESITEPYMVGTSIGGSLILSYVNWILARCMQEGIKRLYFISRDGYLLKKAADILIEKKNLCIKTQYIYGSRRAWRVSSWDEDNCEIAYLLYFLLQDRNVSLRGMADAIHADISVVEKQFSPDMLEKLKSPKLFCQLSFWAASILSNSAEVKENVLEYIEKSKRTVLRYLEQNVDCEDGQFAFVDMCGSGYTQICLAKMLGKICNHKIKTFFFSMNDLAKQYGSDDVNNEFKICFPNSMFNNDFLEMLCRAPHGQVEGYVEQNGKVSPIINNMEESAIEKHGFREYEASILAYANEYANIGDTPECSYKLLESIAKYFAEADDQVLFRYFGDMPHTMSGIEKEISLFAPALSHRQARDIFIKGDISKYHGANLKYSVRRSDIYVKNLYQQKNLCFMDRLLMKIKDRKMYKENEVTFSYPYGIVSGNVVLYAAGNVGKDYHRQLLADKSCRLSLWVDKNYEIHQEFGVRPVTEIRNVRYDYILIACDRMKTVEKIWDDLTGMDGVELNKVIWVKPIRAT